MNAFISNRRTPGLVYARLRGQLLAKKLLKRNARVFEGRVFPFSGQLDIIRRFERYGSTGTGRIRASRAAIIAGILGTASEKRQKPVQGGPEQRARGRRGGGLASVASTHR
jgi:hypothetical protein